MPSTLAECRKTRAANATTIRPDYQSETSWFLKSRPLKPAYDDDAGRNLAFISWTQAFMPRGTWPCIARKNVIGRNGTISH